MFMKIVSNIDKTLVRAMLIDLLIGTEIGTGKSTNVGALRAYLAKQGAIMWTNCWSFYGSR
jgi:hypothetical protein